MDLPAWTQLLSQHNRLVEIETTALPQAFVVERFLAREAISEPFAFELDCLSPQAYLDLAPLLASELTVKLRGPDGQSRTWHGYCTQASHLGSEGGLARFRLKLEPWTAFLRLRRNRLIFQDIDERGIIERLLAHYPQANYRFDISRSLAARAIRTQWESDFDFINRLLAEAGLAYYFEHQQSGGTTADGSSQQASHTLVIYDSQAVVPDASPATLRFHRIDATEATDAAVIFTEQRQVTTNAVTVGSWQREQVKMTAAQAHANSSLPTLEVYQAARSGVFPSAALAQSAADLRLQALQLPARLHAGAGSGRNLAPGYAFTLVQHPDLSGTRFVPLVVEHTAVNNLGSDAVALLGVPELDAGDYRNRFVCIPADTPVVPVFVPKPTAPGPQTALVVGLPDAGISTNRDHEARLQFWWQRGAKPNAGGLQETNSQDLGHAPGDASSGTWVPVAEWSSGSNFGSHFLPRMGSEVLVEFQHGDLDQPVIVAQLYGGLNTPPYAGGEDSQSNHPGVISGMRAKGLDGTDASRWIVDDSPGQLRHQLDTELADSRLGLGLLIDQESTSRGQLRGEGFELSTRGWTIQRAGEGFLVSTSARSGATSTLHDAQEAVTQLTSAVEAAKTLSDAAAGAEGFPLQANTQQHALLKAIDAAQDGHYSGSINGQSATKPKPGSREPGDPVERLADARVLQEGPSHLHYSTPQSLLAYAGGAHHWTVQQDAHFAAAATFSSVSGQSSGLFAGEGQLQLIAANGPVSIQGHTAPLEVLADQAISITSTEDEVQVLAQQKIVMQAGQSSITLEGGDITFGCSENFIVKASQHPFLGGGSDAANLPLLPVNLVDMFNERFRLVADDGATPLSGARYRITSDDNQVWEGTTDEDGLTERVFTRNEAGLTVTILTAEDTGIIE